MESGPTSRAPLEVWAGLECSITRIGEAWRNQIVETGHFNRPEDIDRLAELGFSTLRYPLLWEMHAEHRNWSWMDARMSRLRHLGLKPIAGLVHHGSGPQGVDLLTRDFAYGLAGHARRVARRYPWIEAYTPVNEPLTTARFSALYGHWYPHAQSIGAFVTAVFVQCLATVLAMREIRRVQPNAKLIQTEDLGHVFSTQRLAAQAGYENERRWLSLDLLCGRIDRHHPFYFAFRSAGITDRDLAIFQKGHGRPDVIGVNHYLTSDRFLDHRLERYPREFHGGNGREAYADIAAARTRVPAQSWGPRARLMEAWHRYGIPLAVTEVHNGSTVCEQIRWVEEVHSAIFACRDAGADVRAITAWACFGAVDWPSLLTRRDGAYEAGLFDARQDPPLATDLAQVFRDIALAGCCAHPLLESKGWWKRAHRYHFRARRLRVSSLGERLPTRIKADAAYRSA